MKSEREYRRWAAWAAIPAAVLLMAAGQRMADRRDFQRTFEFAEGELRELRVDNLFGEIVVLGHDGPDVGMKVTERVIAERPEDVARAHRDVELQIESRDGVLDLFVDGPFRCADDRNRWSNHRDRGYQVIYDFELTVPRRAFVDLRTVDKGDIRVAGLHGGFRLSNVTGSLDLEGMRGSGAATTVSAPVHAVFDRAPTGPVRLSSVSDDVELVVPPGTSCDLRLDSDWGEIWTDFDLERVEPPPASFERQGKKLVLRTDSGPVARLGSGGPLVSLESLSGDVYLRRGGGAR